MILGCLNQLEPAPSLVLSTIKVCYDFIEPVLACLYSILKPSTIILLLFIFNIIRLV